MELRRGTLREQALAELAEQQHSVFTARQARGLGFSRGSVIRRRDSGLWVPMMGDVLRPREVRPALLQMAQAAVLAVGPPCAVSHLTAAALWGLEDVHAPCEPDVITLASRRLEVPGVRIHRSRTLSRGDATSVKGIRTTTVARTLIDLAGILPIPDLEDVLDDAIRRRMISAKSLLRKINARPRRGRAGISHLAELLEKRVGRRVGDSSPENRLRRLLVAGGLPEPEIRYRVYEAGRFIAQPDLAYPELKVAIEFDGYRWHTGRKRWSVHAWRHNQLEDLGWRLRHFTTEDLDLRPDDLVGMVRRLIVPASV